MNHYTYEIKNCRWCEPPVFGESYECAADLAESLTLDCEREGETLAHVARIKPDGTTAEPFTVLISYSLSRKGQMYMYATIGGPFDIEAAHYVRLKVDSFNFERFDLGPDDL